LQAVVVRDVLSGQPELFERFKKFIGFTNEDELGITISHFQDGTGLIHSFPPLEMPAVDSEEEMPSQNWSLADIDFSACKRYGPSYRALPKSVRFPCVLI